MFTRKAILDVPLANAELIEPGRLAAIEGVRPDCDIPLLRSGFGVYREQEDTYVQDAPGFSAAAARYVLASLPDLKALATDFVSLAAMKHMEEGCDAHRVLRGCRGYSDRTAILGSLVGLIGRLSSPHSGSATD